MARATIRTRAGGRLVEQVRYPHASSADSEKVRGEKRKKTSEVMRKYNHRSSIRKFELHLAANFIPGDTVGCVTYDAAHEPKTRKEADRRFRYFRQKLQKMYDAEGVELIFFWSTEHKHGFGRWHHHFVCTATGRDYERIRKAWIYGDIEEFRPLEVNKERNYATLAAYYAKEEREKLGLRSWSYSRNARKPETETDIVDDAVRLVPPEGVTVLEAHTSETPYGVFQYLKYLLPPDAARPRVYAKRRRKQK